MGAPRSRAGLNSLVSPATPHRVYARACSALVLAAIPAHCAPGAARAKADGAGQSAYWTMIVKVPVRDAVAPLKLALSTNT